MILILRLYTMILLTYLPIPTARHHRSQWPFGDQFRTGITRLVTQYETGSGLFSWLILMDHSVEGYGNTIYNIFVMKINYTCVSVACLRGYKLYSNFVWERKKEFWHLIFYTIAYGKLSSNEIKEATAGELFVDQLYSQNCVGSLVLLLKVKNMLALLFY